MSITELLNNLPTYIALPLLLLISIGLGLIPTGIVHYSDRHYKERTAVVVVIVVCAFICGAVILSYLTLE